MGWVQRPIPPVPPPDPRPIYVYKTYRDCSDFEKGLNEMWKEGYELDSWNSGHLFCVVFIRRNRK